jgi:nucleotide-binding universal stress UspA family protein
MKTILVAIDFSRNAEHALDYALMYAKKLEASINLIWVDDSMSDDLISDTIERELRKEKKDYLNTLIDKKSAEIPKEKVKILLRKGKVYQEIAKAATQVNADMIFTGTHGASGYEQHWIGSNAYRIVTHAPCPVFTIRSDYDFKETIDDILVPLDSSVETSKKLPFICDFALNFNSRIHLLKVYNTSLSVVRKRIDKYGEEAIKCINNKDVKYELEQIDVKNVASSIIEYGNKSNVDLIAIMTDQDTTTANKFLGPYAKQLINNSEIPIVSVRPKV